MLTKASNPNHQGSKKVRGVVLNLSALDLWHEWVLTLCMILAIAAVLAPLLILMGLKHGTVQTMRDRLIEDPVNREIKPGSTLQLDAQWFTRFGSRDDVGFIIPTILRGASIVSVSPEGSSKREAMDIVPTRLGDPLILENGGQIPQEGECVLSYPASEQLKVEAGERIVVRVSRTRSGRRQREEIELKVIAVLSPRADALPKLYAPLQFVEDVETYRAGHAVAHRNWSGGKPRPPLSFTDLFVVTREPLRSLDARRLTINTGFADVESVDAAGYRAAFGFPLAEGLSVYRLTTVGNPVRPDSLKRVRQKLRGREAILLPWAEQTVLIGGNEESNADTMRIIGLSLEDGEMETLGLTGIPWGRFDPEKPAKSMRRILLPQSDRSPELSNGQVMRIRHTENPALEIPLAIQGDTVGDYAVVPVEMIGLIETAESRVIEYPKKTDEFLLARAGYRGFRMFARSINDIPGLFRQFTDMDIDVITQVREIERIKVLDRGLTRIFWLVAIVGIIGGIAALMASLYAAVERKKRDISVLRLMGLARLEVFRFPVYQGVVIASISVVLAILVYATLAGIINFVFSADLELGQKICTLPTAFFIYAFVTTSGAAILSSLLASVRTIQIDPAEAIREE
uniref:Putative ABC transport system permease protein n=1 Tax=Candidatus Kentrum sp. UNK TaxID=2126344 RepID=A0A451AXJ4_9GAMM|nr:MAG: putative ABC transport system permease protein [Candidatus Kentron sp. UNK]VFK70607.1 MAG: putative ABC transport system permease protein [Candidatus Kentron sp. UNK]